MTEKVHPVSQWRLIWRRFKHHKIGLIGTALVLLFYVVFVMLAEFIAPYNYNSEHREFSYVPPMLTKIRFWDKDGKFSLKPFVYGLKKCQLFLNPLTGEQTCEDQPGFIFLPGKYRWLEDTDYKCTIELFVQGEPYRFWDIWRTDIHLFGVRQEGVPFDPYSLDKSPCQLFLFGSNKLGYDIFSMTLVGGKISLIIGADRDRHRVFGRDLAWGDFRVLRRRGRYVHPAGDRDLHGHASARVALGALAHSFGE
jgi:peptide/nickel transport system permease protein